MDASFDEFALRLSHEAEGLRKLARSLVGDASQADDLLQDGLLAAWRNRGARIGNPGAWLTRVLARQARKQRALDLARAQREHAVARPEVEPAPQQLLERTELLQQVLAAVRSLEPVYQQAVLLVYFEGLAPKEAAPRLGIPEATLRTRLRRALDQLRAKLDRSHGRRAWCVALTGSLGLRAPPTAAPPAAGAGIGGAMVLGGVLVSTKLKVGAALAVLAILGAIGGRSLFRPASAEVAGSSISPTPVAWVDVPNEAVAVIEPKVREQIDPQPQQPASTVAAAPAVSEPLRIPIRGIVVNWRGEPVEGAEVRGDAGFDPQLARTGPDGRFVATSLGYGMLHARAAGYAPSNEEMIPAPLGVPPEMRFVLPGPGYVVEGRVVNGAHQPVAGASVRVGRSHAHPVSGTHSNTPAGCRVSTDEQGRFRVDSVAAGETGVRVVAKGYGAWRGEVDVGPGPRMPLVIELGPEARVRGFARDTRGAPVGGVFIKARGPSADVPAAKTGADGSYELRGLASGKVELEARSGRGLLTTRLVLEAGGEGQWDPIFEPAASLRGRLVVEGALDLSGWRVEASGRSGGLTGESVVSADGSFTIDPAPEGNLRVEVHSPGSDRGRMPVWIEPDVELPRDELVLRVPPGWEHEGSVRGRLLTSGGAPALVKSLYVWRRLTSEDPSVGSSGYLCPFDSSTGSFAMHGLPGGHYTLAGEFPGVRDDILRRFEIAHDGDVDLGDIILPEPGVLAASITIDGAPAQGYMQFSIVWPKPRKGSKDLFSSYGNYERHLPEKIELAPGPYVLTVLPRSSAFSESIEFESRAGETTHLPIDLKTKKLVLLKVVEAAGRPAGESLKLRVRATSLFGQKVDQPWAELELRRGANGFERVVEIQVGLYELEADAGAAGKLQGRLQTDQDTATEYVYQLE